MENEKHFYPTPEHKEPEPKIYQIDFNHKHLGEAKKPVGTYELVGELNRWLDNLCNENGLNPRDKKIEAIGYHIIELGKNALEHAGGGEIKVIFEPSKIRVIVSDQGQGFEADDHVNHSTSAQYGHGLAGVRKYADEFYIETDGKMYAKVKGKRKMINIGISDITTGSKITFIKNFK